MRKVIFTHEQSDFDAAASELAAWLLDSDYIPVLPKHKNRNLSAFLEEFGAEFPFCSWNEVSKSPIDELLLTDCQVFNQNGRITEKTLIRVIDHHEPKMGTPENWLCRYERTGSCATIFIEELKKNRVIPTQLQASLLLLGIYDDTGMLCYGSTTPRDAYAAAWLIEQGGNLDVVRRYLNQPLTETQQQGFDLLLQDCQTFEMEGQKIVLCSADVRDLNEEFAQVAHRLRDILSPDAIVLVLAVKNGVRLIARATNDRVNVGALMRHFNGGGHTRAAAGMVMVEDREEILSVMEEIKTKLPDLIRDVIEPPLQVSRILSTGPLLLHPQMRVEEVIALIQRYGYEGYPVVDDGNHLIGLVNSRSVERARQYGLDLSIETLYEPGTYAVRETDSVEYLKQLMRESGWGQIPVVDAENCVIGIVTRTDLVKAILKPESLPGTVNLEERLIAAVTPAALNLIRIIGKTADVCHYPVYIVGGFVRDLMLRRPVMDFDIVVEGDAVHLGKTLVRSYGGKLIVHAQFGTAKWLISEIHGTFSDGEKECADLPASVDLISSRTEFYERPTALPEVERSSIKLDLHRRDFTINTMALRLDGEHFGEVLDFFGGRSDLNRKIIRVLHSLSFADDPTRMMRAVRFESRFGFEIEPHTLRLIRSALPMLDRLTGQRILHEYLLFFKEDHPDRGMRRLQALGLLSQIHPALSWTEKNSANWKKIRQYDQEAFWGRKVGSHSEFLMTFGPLAAWLGEYSAQEIGEIGSRLVFSQKAMQMLKGIALLKREGHELALRWPSEITKVMEKVPVTSLYALYCMESDDAELCVVIRSFITEWEQVRTVVTGAELQRMGLPAGPKIAEVLARLRAAWLDGEIESPVEEAFLLEKILPNECMRSNDGKKK